MSDKRIYRLVLLTSALFASQRPSITLVAAEPSPHEQETLLLPEDKPWTVALAAPVAAHLRLSEPIPLVVSYSSPPTHELERLLSVASPQQLTVFAPAGQARLSSLLDERKPERFDLGAGPAVASLRVAKRYWRQAKGVVLAMADDAEGIILGSSVAAVMDAPLLLVTPDETALELNASLQSLSAERAIVAASDKRKIAPAVKDLLVSSKVMLPQEMEHCVVDVLGVKNIRTVVVARYPEARNGVGRTAWLAPYMSAARGAPIVLVRSNVAPVAEADVQRLIDREGLHLRSITVLADYGSIGNNVITIEGEEGGEDEPPPVAVPPVSVSAPLAISPTPSSSAAASPPATTPPAVPKALVKTHYLFPIEPFLPRELDKVAQWGVGRIPLESLSDASVLFARGLLRERILLRSAPRMLMVSNAGMPRKPLPLCETICRVTADEFKNVGVHTDEFYGKSADSPDILAAARNAQLILYEGHTGYQDLFDVPTTRRTSPEVYGNDELDELDGSDHGHLQSEAGATQSNAAVAPLPHAPPADPTLTRLQGPLAGMPIIVLQGCDSLDEPVLWRIDELGGVAVIGSVTAIHSGSGSALVQALANSWLYRRSTLGEGLRDAENFMFCLEDLKRTRGHKQQSKGLRVALSFRLWGDPELSVFPSSRARQPKLSPVSAAWATPDTLRIHVPQIRYPEEQSDKYSAQMFPGSQSAGMVKARDTSPQRDLIPVYYFRLPLPDQFADANELIVASSRAANHRIGMRIDRSGKAVCVVYYPEKGLPDEVIDLRMAPQRGLARLPAKGASE